MLNYKYKSLFNDVTVHKDILIVPQLTQVIPREGSTPLIKVFDDQTKTYVEQDKNHPLRFYIDNSIIYKEKFELTESINSADDLAFGSCEPSQVKFTIRNIREQNDKGEYEDRVPPLTDSRIEDLSVVSYQELIKVYFYMDNDSSTMIFLGMYMVEEDKLSKDNTTRDILAYDYLYQLRDMDISNWYKHLWEGITTGTTDEDPNDSDSSSSSSSSTTDDPHCIIRKGKPKWTIYEAINDLFVNLIALDNNDKSYPGYGLQMWYDESILNENSKKFKIFNKMKFEKNKDYIDQSYSLGKFFEDIGAITGAFPKIKRGVPGTDGWCDALGDGKEIQTTVPDPDDTHKPKYTKVLTTRLTDYCVLTFVDLPKYDSEKPISNNKAIKEYQMKKGMTAESYQIPDINLLRIYNSDSNRKTPIEWYSGGNIPTNLIKAYNSGSWKRIEEAVEENKTKKKKISRITNYDLVGNIFFSYIGVKYKEETKKKKDSSSSSSSSSSSFSSSSSTTKKETSVAITDNQREMLKMVAREAFPQITGRNYQPFSLECMCDLTRETGDRIRVINKFNPAYEYDFESYILERKITGVLNMVDTYTAKGSNGLPNFGNYKSGETTGQSIGGQRYASVNGYSGAKTSSDGEVISDGLTVDKLIEINRNMGIRLLDEPNVTKCDFNNSRNKVYMRWEDPDDITDYEPVPCTWIGTVVVRKEDEPPLNIWDGTIIVNSTTRDAYKNTSLVDNTVKNTGVYYYGFFPYHKHLDDSDHPVYYYRFTKVMCVTMAQLDESPKINSVKKKT